MLRAGGTRRGRPRRSPESTDELVSANIGAGSGERARPPKVRLPHQCILCRKRFAKKRFYKQHLMDHDGEAVFPCSVCFKRFPSLRALKAHRPVHAGELAFTCDVCGKSYTRKAALSLHVRAHTHPARPGVWPRGLRHVCHVCYDTFPSRYHLSRHLVMHGKDGVASEYDGDKMLNELLTKSYFEHSFAGASKSISTLLQDASGENGSETVKVFVLEDTHECEVCGRTFLDGDDWERHRETHSDDAPVSSSEPGDVYKCATCDKVFKRGYYLKLHMRTHTGERPYECKECDKKFTTSSKLTRHMRSHAGAKRHQCTMCSKLFTRPSYLRIHMSRHVERSKALLDEKREIECAVK